MTLYASKYGAYTDDVVVSASILVVGLFVSSCWLEIGIVRCVCMSFTCRFCLLYRASLPKPVLGAGSKHCLACLLHVSLPLPVGWLCDVPERTLAHIYQSSREVVE